MILMEYNKENTPLKGAKRGDKMKISREKIEFILAKKNLNVAEAAKIMGVSRQNFSTIKNRGTCWPSTVAKIAKGLGVEVEEILESEE